MSNSTMSGNRFATITNDDQSGVIWVATILCVVYSLLVLIIRAYIRWKLYALDDYFALLATAVHIAEAATVAVALNHGLGKSHETLRRDELVSTNRVTFTAVMLFVAAVGLAKASVFVLLMRLFQLKGSRAIAETRTRVLWITALSLAILSVLWGIGSIVGLGVNCSPDSFSETGANSRCPSQSLRWSIISTFDILSELLFVIISTVIITPLHLKLSSKLPIVFAFSFRLPCAALALAHVIYVGRFAASSRPGIDIVPVIVIMQVQLCWSMISATIPNLKSFVKSFNSGVGLGLDLDLVSGYASSRSRQRSDAIEMSDPRSADTKQQGRQRTDSDAATSTIDSRTKEEDIKEIEDEIDLIDAQMRNAIPPPISQRSRKRQRRQEQTGSVDSDHDSRHVDDTPVVRTITAIVMPMRRAREVRISSMDANVNTIDTECRIPGIADHRRHQPHRSHRKMSEGAIRKDIEWEVSYEDVDVDAVMPSPVSAYFKSSEIGEPRR